MKGATTLVAVANRLQQAQLRLAAAAMVILMMVTVADVLLRYLFNRPIPGSYDLVESMLVVFVFHSMPAAFFGRLNIVIDVIDPAVGERGTRALIHIADVLSVVCLGLLFWAMLGPAEQAYQYGDRKTELLLPMYVLWIVALLGLAGTIFCAVVTLLTKAARVESGPRP
jgi:TRAP-type C4-dicarboxylate transport system permease small subunit